MANSYVILTGEFVSDGPFVKTPLMSVVFETMGVNTDDSHFNEGSLQFALEEGSKTWGDLLDHIAEERGFLGISNSEEMTKPQDVMHALARHYGVEPEQVAGFELRYWEVDDPYDRYVTPDSLFDFFKLLNQESNLSQIRIMDAYYSDRPELFSAGGSFEFASSRVRYSGGTYSMLDTATQIDEHLSRGDLNKVRDTLTQEVMRLMNSIQCDRTRAELMRRVGEELRTLSEDLVVNTSDDEEAVESPGMG